MPKESIPVATTKAEALGFADYVKSICAMGNDIDVSSICLGCQKYRIFPFMCKDELNPKEVSYRYEHATEPETPLLAICANYTSNPPPQGRTAHELVANALAQRT